MRRETEQPELEVPADYAIDAAQRYVLAIGGILTQLNHGRLDLLGGERVGVGAVSTHGGLANWWGIVDGEDACETLDRLLAAHGARVTGEPDNEVAFDLGRVHYIAGSAYVSCVLDAERAWQYCVRAARIAQRAYSSWAAFGAAYAAFRSRDAEAEPEPDDDELENEAAQRRHRRYVRSKNDGFEAVAQLRAPGGGWHDLAWNVEIGTPAPPVLPEPASVRVTTSAELAAAIAAARTGDRIALAPATYTLALRLDDRCLWFVAEADGVIWTATGSESCIMEEHGQFARFEGITFRAPGPLHGAPATCVHVDQGLFSFERCRFEGAVGGVSVDDDATAMFTDCAFACGQTAVECGEDGVVALRGCELVGGDIAAISLQTATARIRRCRIERTGGHAIWMAGGSAIVDQLAAAHTAVSAIAVLDAGSLAVSRSTILDSGESGIFTRSGSRLEVEATRIERAANSGILATAGAHTSLRGCHIRACGHNAVLFETNRGRAEVVDCDLADTGLSVLAISGRGKTFEIARCKLGASRAYDAFFAEDCEFVLDACELAPSPRAGMLIQHARGTLRDVGVAGAKLSAIIAVGAELVIANCRFAHTGSHGIELQEGSTAIITRCRIEHVDATGLVFHESSGIVADTIIAADQGMWTYGADVELHRCELAATIDADAASTLALRDSKIRGRTKPAVIARARTRVAADGCELTAERGACVELAKDSRVTLRDCVLAGRKPKLDRTSKLVEAKPRAAASWKLVEEPEGVSVRTALPPLRDKALPWQRALTVALELVAPALREELYFVVADRSLHAAARSPASLLALQALVARLTKERTFLRWIALACASPYRRPATSLVALLRALTCAGPPGIAPSELDQQGRIVVAHERGFSVTIAADEVGPQDHTDQIFAATRAELVRELGPPHDILPDGASWPLNGARVWLRATRRGDTRFVVTAVGWS